VTGTDLAVLLFAGYLVYRYIADRLIEAEADADQTLSMDWWKDYYAKVVRQRVKFENGASAISVRPQRKEEE
jgi:hypothetical protein